MKTFVIKKHHLGGLGPVTIKTTTIELAAYQALKTLGYTIEEEPDVISLNKKLKKLDQKWHDDYKDNLHLSPEERAENKYIAYIESVAKEFEVDTSRAAQIAWIKNKPFYRPEMLPVLIKRDSFVPDLPLMKWNWKDGKFGKKSNPVKMGAFGDGDLCF